MTDTDRSTGPADDGTPPAPATLEDATLEDTGQDDAPKPDQAAERPKGPRQPPGEIGGRDGPEPTRYGDWEVGGRCTDF